ncbi:MAG: carbohydrate ABC transporter permease [Nitrososphaeria archaeon]
MNVRSFVLNIVLLFIIMFSLTPFILSFMVTIKPPEEVYANPPTLFPSVPTLDNYLNALGIIELRPFGFASPSVSDFPKYILNSFIIAVSVTFLTILIAVPAAYGLTRYKFRGQRTLFLSTLFAYMLPQVVFLIPFYIMFRIFQLLDSYYALTVSYLILTVPFAVYFLNAYFYNVRWDLEEAALIDGCSRVSAMFKIILPAYKPGFIAAGFLAFIQSWGEFLFALVFCGAQIKTAPIGIMMHIGESGVDWAGLLAATMIYALPAAVIYLVFQSYFIKGLTSGAFKG